MKMKPGRFSFSRVNLGGPGGLPKLPMVIFEIFN